MAPEVFNEQRESLQEVLWKKTHPVGLLIEEVNAIREHNWNFSNLENAFKEDGVLHLQDEKVFLFTCAEAAHLFFNGQWKIVFIPVVAAIVSGFTPCDKIGINYNKMEPGEIVEMQSMNLGWVPYIPPGDDSVKSKIFILSHVQTSAGIENLLSYAPYFNNPFKTQEERTVIEITYPTEAEAEEEWPQVCEEYNWELNDPEIFTRDLIFDGLLSPYHKETFKMHIWEKVEEGKKKASKKHHQAAEELRSKGIGAIDFEWMNFYKFYPVATRNTPDISPVKSSCINRYFGKAHKVF